MDIIADNILLILIIIFALVIVIAAIYSKTKFKRPTDYKALFFLGITWIPLGIFSENNTFLVLGIVFMITGFKNKSKWEENRFRWSEMSQEEKRTKKFFIGLLVLIALLSVLFYFYG